MLIALLYVFHCPNFTVGPVCKGVVIRFSLHLFVDENRSVVRAVLLIRQKVSGKAPDVIIMSLVNRQYPPRNKILVLIGEWDKLPQQLLNHVVESILQCTGLRSGCIPY
ncbi:hypothetical protein CDAR_179361 [Caerostris darwini]|uniref:Uncharacterized protein n=1 Tax=Caerostris darwini TaxID=1538125 RepID=A0AAV4PBD6_9ARAC|nr:hypothetical protein CDAR_179361 [Caerostris darwini]